MLQVLRRISRPRVVRVAALCAAVGVAWLLMAPDADAQSGTLGPGPFASITIDQSGLTFVVDTRANTAVRFDGAPTLQATASSGFEKFSAPGRVKSAGKKLIASGHFGAVSIDAFFPE